MDAFTTRQLQESVTLLRRFQVSGMTTIDQVMAEIVNIVKGRVGDIPAGKPLECRREVKPELCPSCRIPMRPVVDKRGEEILVDGLPVLGCKQCRYSKIVEVKTSCR